MIKAIFVIALMASVAHGSAASESDDYFDGPNSPSPRTAIFYNFRRIQDSSDLQRCSSEEALDRFNYPTHVYDDRSFLPLEITNTELIPSAKQRTDQDEFQIENTVRGVLKKFNIEDTGMVSKTLTTFFLAILFLLIYNGFFLRILLNLE